MVACVAPGRLPDENVRGTAHRSCMMLRATAVWAGSSTARYVALRLSSILRAFQFWACAPTADLVGVEVDADCQRACAHRMGGA
jgi:hypothetical protein